MKKSNTAKIFAKFDSLGLDKYIKMKMGISNRNCSNKIKSARFNLDASLKDRAIKVNAMILSIH